MTAKKIILLVEPDEIEQAALAYALGVAGFRVLRPENPLSMRHAVVLAPRAAAALLSNRPPKFNADAWARMLRGARNELPICVLSDKADPPFPSAAMTVDRTQCPMAELLERLKQLTKRKRGPRPGAQRKVARPLGETR